MPFLVVASTVLPPAPRNLTAINIKKTSLTVNWRPPLYFDHYSVEKYVIKCKEFSGSWKNLEAPGKHMNTFFLDDLEPDTSYSIQAHAMNHVGEGLPSKTIEIKTLSGRFKDVCAHCCVQMASRRVRHQDQVHRPIVIFNRLYLFL